MKKSISTFAAITLAAVSTTGLKAQEEAPELNVLPSVIVFKSGGAEQRRNVYLLREDKGSLIYSLDVQGTNPERLNMSQIEEIGFVLPDSVNNALHEFAGSKYKSALPLLEKEAEWLARLEGLPNSPYFEIRYRQIFAMQETGDYDGALKLYEELDKSKLTPYQAGMLATIPAWPIYKAKQWDRLITVCEGLRQTVSDLPLASEVRLSFLLGEAYSRQDTKKALAEYYRAMTLDAGESAEILAKAALGSLAIYDRDDQVKEFFRLRGRPEFVKTAGYSIPARAAAWVAKMMDTQQPAGIKLPKEFERYLEVYKMYDDEAGSDDAAPAEEADAGGE